MRPSFARCLAFAASITLAAPAAGEALQPVPALRARVTDLTGTLSSEEVAALEHRLADFEARRGSQVAVLIVPTTEPEAIEQFSIRVVEAWRLGREQPDDGVLLLLAKEDRRLRIEVGRGLEGALTDLVSKRIVADIIVPHLRAGDFYGGLEAGVEQILRVIEGEALPPPAAGWEPAPAGDAFVLIPLLVFAVLGLAPALRNSFGRGLGSLLTGGVAGGLVWLISRILGLSLLAGLLGFLFALALGASGRRGWASHPRRGGPPGGWRGGFGGGGGGFGSGGGGFGGGGGSFGGGGASGSW